MKPHNQAALSVGKAAVLVVALVAGAGLAGAFGDGKDATGSVKHFKLFDIKQTNEPKKPARKKKHTSSEPPPMTCDGDQCWWTDLGRPK